MKQSNTFGRQCITAELNATVAQQLGRLAAAEQIKAALEFKGRR